MDWICRNHTYDSVLKTKIFSQCLFYLCDSFWQVRHPLWIFVITFTTAIMMNSNDTESWLLINTSSPTPPTAASVGNRSGKGGYLDRLAHLDEGLYNDFYGVWIALMVINSLIFLVGSFKAIYMATLASALTLIQSVYSA